MEEFKSIQDLLEADLRWNAFSLVDTETFRTKPYSLEDRYASVARILISKSAHEDIQSQFNIAKMLHVYAWLYYPLHQVAELKAYSTLEHALQHRFPGNQGLHKLLTLAINGGLIEDSDFSHVIVDPKEPMKYAKSLPTIIPKLRNSLAHGEFMLYPGSLFTLRNCSEIINKIA